MTKLTVLPAKTGSNDVMDTCKEVSTKTPPECTLRPAMAATESVSAKGVRRSSLTNWLSWECVRLQKKTWRFWGAASSSSFASSVSEPSLSLPSVLHHALPGLLAWDS